jgi:hypothetical protein
MKVLKQSVTSQGVRKALALIVSLILGLICAVALGGDLPVDVEGTGLSEPGQSSINLCPDHEAI